MCFFPSVWPGVRQKRANGHLPVHFHAGTSHWGFHLWFIKWQVRNMGWWTCARPTAEACLGSIVQGLGRLQDRGRRQRPQDARASGEVRCKPGHVTQTSAWLLIMKAGQIWRWRYFCGESWQWKENFQGSVLYGGEEGDGISVRKNFRWKHKQLDLIMLPWYLMGAAVGGPRASFLLFEARLSG